MMADSLDFVVFVELPMIALDDSHDLFVFWNNNIYGMCMREQTDCQFLTEKVFEDFYYVLTLFCIIRYHIHIPYHFCLLNSCFGIYKSILVAALKIVLAAETNS
jgi:hypothetical protein